MLKRILAGLFGALNAANGVFMLADGPLWYASVPGAAHTGPYNPHFIADIGAAFLVAGAALLARAWRPRYWPAALAGAGFIGFHAMVHLIEIAGGHTETAAFDLSLIVVPAVLAAWAAFPAKGEKHAQIIEARLSDPLGRTL